MKMKNIGKFFKKYGFYMAVGVIAAGALAAFYLSPNKDGNIKEEANPYAANRAADGAVVDELQDSEENEKVIIDFSEDEAVNEVEQVDEVKQEEEVVTQENTEVVDNESVETQNFESTTAQVNEPFFAEGDTFTWPVEGDVVVPYTDETTKYWFSESLNQTMRTFGVCIGANEGEEVIAAADGKVVEIVGDSSTLDSDLPYVGKAMVIDHGNGYTSIYGFQNGEPNEDLLGQTVSRGDVLGKVGGPTGAFIAAGDNIYLQVMHNDEVISPLKLLKSQDAAENVAKTDAVDTGFAE